ncbi:hypothetical protein EG329_005181 [Mollisiaceae sp. DMI_Dod_QoI]|nr:hypothetical protein EG329_005181 [Helotiales sp. DMI_Dod_QoI]
MDPMITGTMQHVSLDNDPQYIALSYVWGDPQITKPIVVDDQTVDITTNLWAALSAFVPEGESDFVWIDAICINQLDDLEKSSQVGIMYEIYQQATFVVAWIGPNNADFLPLQFLAKIGHHAVETRGFNESTGDPSFAHEMLKFFSHFGLQFAWELFNCKPFFDSAYWTRMWILQEMCFAKGVLVVCGNETIPVTILRAAIISLVVSGMELSSPNARSIISFSTLASMKLSEKFPLSELLIIYIGGEYGLQATDPRDKVFALLNMAKDATRLGLKADYSQNCKSVYTNTVRALIEDGDFDTLFMCEMDEKLSKPSSPDLALPTWVPNFAALPTTTHFGHKTYYSACGSSKHSANFLSQDGRECLLLDGFQIDTLLDRSLSLDEVYIKHGGDRVREEIRRTQSMPHKTLYLSDGLMEKASIGGQMYWEFENMFKSHGMSERELSSSGAHWKVPIVDHQLQENGPAGYGDDPSTVVWKRACQETYDSYRALRGWSQAPANCDDKTKWFEEQSLIYVRSMSKLDYLYRGFLTYAHHYVGLGPNAIKAGDIVVIFLGVKVPYILRKARHHSYQIVGPCYVHGVMEGELMDTKPHIETFSIS